MDAKLVRNIRRNLDAKPIDELIQIYRYHNAEEWSSEAFEAIRQILIARGEAIPAEEERTDANEQENFTFTSDSSSNPVSSLRAPLKLWVPAAGLASMLMASMIIASSDRVHMPPFETLGYAVGAIIGMSLLSFLGIGIVAGIVKLLGTVKSRQWYQTVFWAFGGLWLLLALLVALNKK